MKEGKNEIAKCQRELTKEIGYCGEVAPKALAPQIAMNSADLARYKLMGDSKFEIETLVET